MDKLILKMLDNQFKTAGDLIDYLLEGVNPQVKEQILKKEVSMCFGASPYFSASEKYVNKLLNMKPSEYIETCYGDGGAGYEYLKSISDVKNAIRKVDISELCFYDEYRDLLLRNAICGGVDDYMSDIDYSEALKSIHNFIEDYFSEHYTASETNEETLIVDGEAVSYTGYYDDCHMEVDDDGYMYFECPSFRDVFSYYIDDDFLIEVGNVNIPLIEVNEDSLVEELINLYENNSFADELIRNYFSSFLGDDFDMDNGVYNFFVTCGCNSDITSISNNIFGKNFDYVDVEDEELLDKIKEDFSNDNFKVLEDHDISVCCSYMLDISEKH